MKKVRRIFAILCLVCLLFQLTGCIDIQEVPPYIEVTVEEEVYANRFYYGQLSDAEQMAYREIYQGLIEHQDVVYMHMIDPEVGNRVLHSVVSDFGEIFWTDGAAVTSTYEETFFSKAYTTMEINYIYTAEEKAEREEHIKVVADKILNAVPSTYSEYEKVKYIYEYLVKGVDYVEGAPDNQNIYSALVGKRTVCAGYAKAVQYLLTKLGVHCTYVTGKATAEDRTDAHAWNIVRCNGKYYYVDVTWADPLFMEDAIKVDDIIYDYLCCSENVIGSTHTLDEGYEYPACNSEDLDYYRLNNMFYDRADSSQILRAMKNSINGKAKSTVFKFANSELYAKGRQMLLDSLLDKAGTYLCERYHLRHVEYYYVEYENTNRFVVCWQYKS